MKIGLLLLTLLLSGGCIRRAVPIEHVLWSATHRQAAISLVYSGLNERRGTVELRWTDVYNDPAGRIVLFWTREFPEATGFKSAFVDVEKSEIVLYFEANASLTELRIPIIAPGNSPKEIVAPAITKRTGSR